MIFEGYPRGTQVEILHPGEAKWFRPGVQLTVTKHQIADLQTAKS